MVAAETPSSNPTRSGPRPVAGICQRRPSQTITAIRVNIGTPSYCFLTLEASERLRRFSVYLVPLADTRRPG